MIDLIEELKIDNGVFVLMKSFKNFIFGEYVVTEVKYHGTKKREAIITLKDAKKKQRYFKPSFKLLGFLAELKNGDVEYILFSEYDDMIAYYCSLLAKNPSKNIKLLSKFKKRYPKYF